MSRLTRYTRTAMFFHWTVGILIILNVVLALAWTNNIITGDALVREVITFHKSTGMLVLVLVILRLAWRATHHAPPLPATYKSWEVTASHLVHIALYLVALGLPLSGWAHDSAGPYPYQWYGLFHAPNIAFIANLAPAAKTIWHTRLGLCHAWFGYALYALLAAHVLGALKHQLIDKEPELQRMLPGGTGE